MYAGMPKLSGLSHQSAKVVLVTIAAAREKIVATAHRTCHAGDDRPELDDRVDPVVENGRDLQGA
jgi:hypothetical protein